ncbi:hypothetical protein CSUI_001295 [Cystoisospora suis]|uniref:Uncharacterized protein n=1 Tax=Cystoisospora suis TaxID=483139 RepID=A0A2C6LCW9_9APIC|nr:hypothetical protein CSUI_001295 [Cystoisospora suis]
MMGPPSRRRSKDSTSSSRRDTSPGEKPSLRTETLQDKWGSETPKTVLEGGMSSERRTRASVDPETAKEPSFIHDYRRTAFRRETDGPGERHRIHGTTELSPGSCKEASDSSIGDNGESDTGGNHRSTRRFLTVGREGRRAGSCEGVSERDLKMKLTGELFPDILDDVSSTRCSSNRGTERTTTGSAASSSRCESSSSETSWGAPVDAHHRLRPPTLRHHVSRQQQKKRQVTESRDKAVSALSEVLTPGTSLAHWRQETEDRNSSWYAPTGTRAVGEEQQSASCRDRARERYEESEERRPGTETHRTLGGEDERERECWDNRGPFNRSCESRSTELQKRTEDSGNTSFSSASSLSRGTRREKEQEDVEHKISPRQQASGLALTPELRGRRQSPKLPTSRKSRDVAEREEEVVSATRHSPRRVVGVPGHHASRERIPSGHHTEDSIGSVSDAREAEDVVAREVRREAQEVKETKGGIDMRLSRSRVVMPARSSKVSQSTWQREGSTENDTGFHGQEIFLRDEKRGQCCLDDAVGRRRRERREKLFSSPEFSPKDRTEKAGSRILVSDSLLKRIEESRHKMRRHFTRGRETYSPSAQQTDAEDDDPRVMRVSHAERKAADSPPAAAAQEPSRDTSAAAGRDLTESRRLHLKSKSQSPHRACFSARQEVDSETEGVRNKNGVRPVTCRTSRDGLRPDIQQRCRTSPPVQLRKSSGMWSTRRASDTSSQRDRQRPVGLETYRDESRTPGAHAQRSPLRSDESPCRYVERWSESGHWTRCPGNATERAARIAPRARASVSTTGSRSTLDIPLSAETGGGSETVHRGTEFPKGRFHPSQTAKHYTKDRRWKPRDEAGASRSSYSPPPVVSSPCLLSRRAVPPERQMQDRNGKASRRQPSSPITSDSLALSGYSSLSDTFGGTEKVPNDDISVVCKMRESENSSGEERAPYPKGDCTAMREASRSPHSSYSKAFSGRRNPARSGNLRDGREHHNIGNTQKRSPGVLRGGSTSGSLVVPRRSIRQSGGNEKAGHGGDFRRSHTERSHREKFDSHPRTSHSRRVCDVSTMEKGNRNRSAQTQIVPPAGRRCRTEDLSVSSGSSIWSDDGSVARPCTGRSESNQHMEHRVRKRDLPASAPWKTEGESGSAFCLEEQLRSMPGLSRNMDGGKRESKTQETPQSTLPSPLAQVRNMQCNLETVIAQLKERHEFLDNHNVPSFPSPRPPMKHPTQLHENNSGSPRNLLHTGRALPAYTQSVLPSRTTTTAATTTDFAAPSCNVQTWGNQSSTDDEMALLSQRLATARVCMNRTPINPAFHGGASPGAFAPLLPPYPPPVTQEAPSASCCPQLFQVPGVSCHHGQYIAFGGGPRLAGAQPMRASAGRLGAYSDASFLHLWQKNHGNKVHNVIQETSKACLPPHSWAASHGVEQQGKTVRCSRSGVPPNYSRAGIQTVAFIAPHVSSQADWSRSSTCVKALPRCSADGSLHLTPSVPPSRSDPPAQQVDEEITRSPQTFVVEPACCQPLSPSLFSTAAAGRQEVRCRVPTGDGQSAYTAVTPRSTSLPLATARFGVPTARDSISPYGGPMLRYPWARRGPTPEDELDSRFSSERPGGCFGPMLGGFGGAVNSPLCPFGAAAIPSQECDHPFVPEGGMSRPFASPSWSALAAERHRPPQTRNGLMEGFPGAPSATFPVSHSAATGDPMTSLQSEYPSQSGVCGTGANQEEVKRWIQSSGAAVPSHRLLQILQRRSNHRSPGVQQAGVRTEAPHIRPAAPMVNAEGRRASVRYGGEPVSSMGTQIGQPGRLRAPAGPDNERLQSSFAWSPTGRGCPRNAGIGGSGLGPFGTNQLILAKLMDGLEAAHRRLQVTHGRRASPLDSPGAPSTLAPVSGGAQAVARGREIFDSLNARWRRFKALEDSPKSSHAVGSCSGSSTESPYFYSVDTGHTENPMRHHYAVHDFYSPLGAAGFMGNPSGDIRWGGGPPAGEPSAAFRLKINTLNQRMASVVGREHELLHDLQKARQKWCSETSAHPVRPPAAGDVGTSPVRLTPGDREPVRRLAAPDASAHPTSGHSPRSRLSVSPRGRTTHRLASHSRDVKSPRHSRLEAPPPTSGASGAPAPSGRGGKALSPRGSRAWSGHGQARSQLSPSPSRELMKTISNALMEGPALRGGAPGAEARGHQSAEWPSGANLRHLSLPLSSLSRDYGGRQTEVDSPPERPPLSLHNPERAQLLLRLEHGSSARSRSSSGLPVRPRLTSPQNFGGSRLKEREESLRRRLTDSETRAVAEETLKQARCLDPILHTEEDELLQSISEHLKRQHP